MSSPAKKLHEQNPGSKDSGEICSKQILAKVSLFADIKDNTEAFSAIYELMKTQVYRQGETIIKEGDTGNDFYILVNGNAGVYKKTQDGDLYKVAILNGQMGAFFGESGLLESDTRTATITAESECHCLVLSKADFDLFCNANPQWALPVLKRVAKAIMNRLKNMNHDLGLLYKALVDEFAQR